MQPVSMTHFIDFVLTVGSGRIAIARDVWQGKEVDDFYKPMRQGMIDMHQSPDVYGGVLDAILAAKHVLDDRQRRVFPKVVSGYKKWLRGAGEVQWFEPPLREYPLGPLSVRVVGDLGLLIKGKPHTIKLYFRGDPLTPSRALVTTELMSMAFAATWPGMAFSVLDVRRAKLWTHRPKPGVQAWLRGEAACLSTLVRETSTSH